MTSVTPVHDDLREAGAVAEVPDKTAAEWTGLPATAVPVPLSEARRDVLYCLKRRGEASVEEISSNLGMSAAGARQHLSALTDQGLVVTRDEPVDGRGRPRLLYRVSATSDAFFPKAYGDLTNELLDFLDDPDLEEALFNKRRDQRIERASLRLAGRDLAERVAVLSEILDEDGYMASWIREPDGSFVIAEQNCAIAAVAGTRSGPCRSEIEFIQAVLPDAVVERTSHIVSGDVRCAYRVTPS